MSFDPARQSIDERRRDRSALVAMLESAGSKIRGSSCTCPDPTHDDHRPSASIHSDAGGIWRVTCHGCGFSGDVVDVEAALSGCTAADALRDHRSAERLRTPASPRKMTPGSETPGSEPPARPTDDPAPMPRGEVFRSAGDIRARVAHVSAVYRYQRADGSLHCVVLRMQRPGKPKEIRQLRPVDPSGNTSGGVTWGGPLKPHPLYRSPEIAQAGSDEPVIVCEGEGVAGRLAGLGFCSTTSLGGAGKAAHTDWGLLAGRAVILWPDHDEPGAKHARDILRLLDQLPDPPRSVRLLDPAKLGLLPKGDAVDYVSGLSVTDPGEVARAVGAALDLAEPVGPSGEVGRLLDDAISGRRWAVDLPWPALGGLSKALTPGTVTLLAAPPGASKSLFVVEAAAYWHDHGISAAVLMLEDGRAYHLRRALAQRAGLSGITDDAWTKDHPEQARAAMSEHAGWLDSFGRVICEPAGDDQPTYDDVLSWLETQADAGRRVAAVDPLTICKTEARPWEADQQFIAKAKRIAERSGMSLLLIMHPRKLAEGRGVDDVAGGAAFGRLAQTVWFLEAFETKRAPCRDRLSGITCESDINRLVHISKARNGRGSGLRVGFAFDPETLRLREVGVVVKRERDGAGG